MESKDDLSVGQIRPEGDFEEGEGAGKRSLNRRQFLRTGVLSAACLVSGFERLDAMPGQDAVPGGGRFISLINFEDEASAPVGTPIATELDGRLYTDLSRLSIRRPVTPSDEFY